MRVSHTTHAALWNHRVNVCAFVLELGELVAKRLDTYRMSIGDAVELIQSWQGINRFISTPMLNTRRAVRAVTRLRIMHKSLRVRDRRRVL